MNDGSENRDVSVKNPEIGRVLRASTAGFAVGCRVGQLAEPSFGSLVMAQPLDQREAVYGLIYDMHIDDDPLVRRLVLAEEPGQAVIEDQRSNRLLPIEMSVLAIGYKLGGTLYHGLPPRPPLNLDPVYLCRDPALVREFSDRPSYLRLILRASAEKIAIDQLLVAHLRSVYTLRGDDLAWADRTVKALIEMLRSDYDLLLPLLEAVGDAFPNLGTGDQGLGIGHGAKQWLGIENDEVGW